MTRFCPDCGNPHECTAEQAGAEKAEVAIEKLRTNRDIEVARIGASASRDIAETEAESGTAHAEGIAEGMETALDAVTGGGEPDGGQLPVVVEGGGDPEPEPEETPDVPPPPDVPEPEPEPYGSGWWDGYR